MIHLKDFYTKGLNLDYNEVKNSLQYLSELTSRASIEIDTFICGKNIGFNHVKEFAEILEEYQLKDTDKSLVKFPYMAFWKGIKKNSDKTIRYISDLALEMNLFKNEIKNISSNPEKLKELCFGLCNLSREFSNELHVPVHA